MAQRRVVITAAGAATPLGLTMEQTWSGLCEGKSGIDKIKAFDPSSFKCQLAGEVPDFKVRKYVPKKYRKATKLMCRDIELAVVAADDAIKSSGLITKAIDPENVNIDPTRFGINVGAGLISCDLEEIAPAVSGSLTDGEFDIKKWGREGMQSLTPLWLLKYLPNMLACHIGIIHDIQGVSNTITCGEVSGLLSIIEASETILRSACDITAAGAAEAKVNPIVMSRQCILNRAASDYNDTPDKACRPFDKDAKGSVFGEAGAMLILEELETAKQRNAEPLAEIAGVGQSTSINNQLQHLESDGKAVSIAVKKALTDAGIEPHQLDLVIPHGTGIPADDIAESNGLNTALGEAVKSIPVFPSKSMLSTTGAASGALDLAIAAKAMQEGKIPAAKNCEQLSENCNLNINRQLKQININYALCCGYTYGGQTAAIVLKNING